MPGMDSADAQGILAFEGCKYNNCCIRSQPMPLKKKPETETAKDERTTMRTLHIRIRDKHAKYLRQ